SDTRTGT
ncbi:unnamed protein product, partial [Medioppia subpectinata]